MRHVAIRLVHPEAQIINGDYDAYDENGNKIVLDEESIASELETLVTQKQSEEYKQIRAREYPRIADQLDMLWHAIDSGALNKTSDFYTTIKAVKDTYPKSE